MLDKTGAEHLLGKGDMLYKSGVPRKLYPTYIMNRIHKHLAIFLKYVSRFFLINS